jgi:REP element-mobilizing transposase RayT
MKTKSQLHLIPRRRNPRFFGGSLLLNRRKSRRPLSSSEAIHIVLRSTFACGAHSFRSPHREKKIEILLRLAAKKYGIKIYRCSIQSNHLHLILKTQDRWSYRCFISVISGKIASLVMNNLSFRNFLKEVRGEGSQMRQKGQAFWEFRPFTRILYWGKDFQFCSKYLLQNSLEALGFIVYRPRINHYRKFQVNSG